MNEEITTIKKKKWYKRKLFYVLAVIGLLIAFIVYGQIKKANQPPSYETIKVEKGTISQTVDATGNVESANELDLRFESSGRIGHIYKQTGDKVKSGNLLVDLELGSLNASVAQASAGVRKAQADLDKQLAGNTGEYIASMQAKLDKANADLDQIKASSASAVSNAEATLQDAENNLELAEGGENSQIVQDAYDDMVALLSSVQNTLSEALVEADNILGIDNTYVNDSFQNDLSNMEPSKKATAESDYRSARIAKNNADVSINAVSLGSSHDLIDKAADDAEDALVSIKNMLFSVSAMLDKTTAVGNITETSLGTMKADIQTARSGVSVDYASLINQKQAVVSAGSSYNSYKIAYDKVAADLINTKSKATADIAAYEALVHQAEANFNDADNPPREVDVASYRASLSSAYASLSQAVANRNKSRIIAPLDGLIGKINGKVGEFVSSQDTVVKLVSPHFEIKVDIPETDIIKLTLDDEAIIKLDAYGDEVEFLGKVTEIEKGETIIQDVVYYTVTVSMEENDEYEVLNGMTADVMFYTEEKEDVLYISQRSVRTNDEGDKFVRVLEGREVKDVIVKTGLRGDGGVVEILEGLSEGQEVVVSVLE